MHMGTKAVKRNKPMNKRQINMLMNKADKIKAITQEEQRIIRGKLQERINQQAELEGVYCKRVYLGEILSAMEKEINDSKDKVYVQWESVNKNREVFIAQYRLELYNYKQVLRREMYLKDNFKSLGFGEGQLMDIMLHGIYIKDLKQLEEMEQKYLEPIIKEQEKLNDELIAMEKNETK